MAETGIVMKEHGNLVTVKLERNEACAKCKACTAGLASKDMFLEAENLCQAKEGDIVTVSLEHTNFLKAVIIMYVFPLIALLGGIAIGYYVSSLLGWKAVEIVAIIIGAIFTAITYFVIRLNDEKFRTKEYTPVADGIVAE